MRLTLALLSLFISATAHATAPAKLVLNWKAEPEFGGFYEAERIGAYKKHGISVKVQEGGAGTPVVQMVATGAADFGIAAADDVIVSQDRGTDVIALFVVYQTSPLGIMVHEEQGLKSIPDLMKSKGTLAMQNGAMMWQYLMRKYPKPSVKVVPYTGGVTNFIAQKDFAQQCYVTAEPIAARRGGANVRAFRVANEGFNPYNTVLVARRKTLEEKPEQVKALLAAVTEGWEGYLASPAEANRLMNRINPSMDLATFDEIAESQKELIFGTPKRAKDFRLGAMDVNRWETLAEQLRDLGLIKKVKPAEAYFKNL